jgi:hypothetical protein
MWEWKMKLKNRLIILSSIVILTLLVNLAFPVTALADEETPPPLATEEPAEPPAEEPAEVPTPTEEEPTVAEVLEELPEGTEVVIVNEDGQAEPLATEQAAEIAAFSDPVWCPNTQSTPTPGSNGCTSAYSNMTDLLTYLTGLNAGTGPSADGTIWIEDSYDSSVNDAAATNFTLDGNTLTTWTNNTLTIQGGWDGNSGSDMISGSSEFNVPVSVLNWGNHVTLNNLFFDNSTGNGLEVTTVFVADADIVLTDIKSTDHSGSGAVIANNSTSGTVTINDGTFNRNDGDGLQVTSNGDVFIGGTNEFNANGEYGLYVESNGDVDLENVIANRNEDESGAYIDNTGGNGDVSITGVNSFNANDEYGLYILSNGDIDLENVTASRNDDEDGAYLDNCLWNGSVCSGSGDITVEGNGGTNSFNDNGGNGIEAYSGGDIDLSDAEANRNGSHGAYLYNADGGSGDITLSDFVANFNEDGNGLFAHAADDVDLDGGEFRGNDRRGVVAKSDDGDIDILFSEFINNGMSGLRAEAYDGDIFLYEIYSDNNGTHGANLGSGGNIFIDDSEFYDNDNSGVHIMGLYIDLFVLDSNFSDNHGHGLDVEYVGGSVDIEDSDFEDNNKNGLNLPFVEGSIEISSSDFEDNGHNGAYLFNCGCTISDIMIDTSSFDDNGWNGLEAYAYGEIELDDVTADGNGDNGAYLDNTNGSGNITVENSQFNDNGDDDNEHGLWIESNGDVSLDDVTASNNYYAGASLGSYDYDSLIGGNVFISYSTFNQNGVNGNWDGLDVFAGGNVTLDNVTASENGYAGAWLGGTYNDIPISGTVTILDSTFNDNDDQGVYIDSVGNIFIDPSSFNNNGDYGIEAYSDGNITILDATVNGNGEDGAYLDTNGNARICNSTFDTNNGFGIDASNVGGTLTLGNNIFNGNTDGTYDYSGSVGDCVPSGGGGGGGGFAGIIPVTGGEQITCDESQTSVKVMLANGNFVTLACPINEYAIVDQALEDGLPAPLEDGNDFISATTALVIRANQPVGSLEDAMVVSFLIPDGMQDAEFAILFWDGTQWVELEGKLSEDGLHFEVTTSFAGIFVLVTK